jgi:arginine utilization protein RocB
MQATSITNVWFTLVRELTLALVRFPSVTNTPGEVAFAQYFYDLLAERPYFATNPDDLRIERAPADPHGRSNVFALVRGAGPETVVLTGHYDIVSTANYGDLEPYACDPEALLPSLIADLAAGAQSAADRQALDDLQSGAFMPGRGALDMKSGLAAGTAVLDRFAALPERRGNLLLIATPDEEQTSEGMRAAAARLPALAAAWGLAPVAAINLDSTGDRSDGRDGQAIFMGSVGKLLPSVYLVGRDTHAGAPFDGVSANLLAAEVTRRIECSPELADSAEGETAPPPVVLKQADLKQGYDVTTPAAAWCYYNLLTHSWSPSEALAKIVRVVEQALDEAMALLGARARRYAELASVDLVAPSWRPQTLTFAELKRRALERGGAVAEAALGELIERLRGDLSVDLPLYCRQVTELLWRHSGLTGPAAVVGFASLYYPRVFVGDAPGRQARLRATAARQAEQLAQETGVSIRLRPFFPGISDMSFLGCADAPDELALVLENTPAWGSRIHFDYAGARELDLAVINVGPWGRDYHQRLERIYMPYSFGVMPELVWRIVGDLLEHSPERLSQQ